MADMTALLKKLIDRTNRKAIEWETTSVYETFIAVVSDTIIEVGRYRREPYVKLKDNQGNELIQLDITDHSTEAQDILVRGLFEVAKESALKIDQTIDRLLVELNEPDDEGTSAASR